MSWLDFANHFLSNQRLHVWSWINRTFLGNGFFWWEIWLWVFLVLFLFCFCLVRGEKVASAQDFGWKSKGEDHFRSWLPFFLFTWWQFCIVQILSGPKTFLHISSVFFRSLIGNFVSFFLSQSLIGEFSFLFFFSFFFKDWHSHPGSRFMISWNFGSRLVEQLVMIYVRVWPAVRG